MTEDLSKPATDEELEKPEKGYEPPVFLRADEEGVIDLGILLHQQYPSEPSEPPCPDNYAWEFVAEVLMEELHTNLYKIETRSNSEHIHRLGMSYMLAAMKEVAKQLANCRIEDVRTYYYKGKLKSAEEEFRVAEDQWKRGIRR